jgi:hypothetical protein
LKLRPRKPNSPPRHGCTFTKSIASR